MAQLCIFGFAICAGVLLRVIGRNLPCVAIFGMVLFYFGVDSGFSLYMKYLLSDVPINAELNLKGVPAAFLITAVQQVETFMLMVFLLCALSPTSLRYWPRKLRASELKDVVYFGLAFAVNVGLNNLSLSLLPLSLNLTIRCCLPPVTLAVQVFWRLLTDSSSTSVSPRTASVLDVAWGELMLMMIGVLSAGLVTLAKGEDPAMAPGSRTTFWLGVLMVCISVVAAAVMLALVQRLGSRSNLNTVDISVYMSLPAAVALLPPMLLSQHPVGWPGEQRLTDMQVLQTIAQQNPGVLVVLFGSGVMALFKNLLQYWMVQSESATFTAFANNVNNAGAISVSIILGLEQLPGGFWCVMMCVGIFGNLGSFTAFTLLKAARQRADAKDDRQLAKASGSPEDILRDGGEAGQLVASTRIGP